MKASEFLHL